MQRYTAQAEAVNRRGPREGKRLTYRGYQAATPRFMPRRCGSPNVLYYQRDDGDTLGGFYRADLDGGDLDASAELVAFANGRVLSFDAGCSLIFDHTAPSQRRYSFSDLFACRAASAP